MEGLCLAMGISTYTASFKRSQSGAFSLRSSKSALAFAQAAMPKATDTTPTMQAASPAFTVALWLLSRLRTLFQTSLALTTKRRSLFRSSAMAFDSLRDKGEDRL